MAWFFADAVTAPIHTITGEDARHIIKSLRMTAGEELTICDSERTQHDCIIEDISSGEVTVKILSSHPCENEPHTKLVLYQALPKGDKMDYIVQKSVELGVSEIVPIITARCVSRPDEKSTAKKLERWNKIALQAAMQSRRAFAPKVQPVMNLAQAAQRAADTRFVVCYECGGAPMGEIVRHDDSAVSLFIGSEGGFAQEEIDKLTEHGARAATLGKRILRAETAPIAAASIVMYITGSL